MIGFLRNLFLGQFASKLKEHAILKRWLWLQIGQKKRWEKGYFLPVSKWSLLIEKWDVFSNLNSSNWRDFKTEVVKFYIKLLFHWCFQRDILNVKTMSYLSLFVVVKYVHCILRTRIRIIPIFCVKIVNTGRRNGPCGRLMPRFGLRRSWYHGIVIVRKASTEKRIISKHLILR